jgi:RNA polymerase sigma-70 factor (ECF subfamily)
MSQVTSVRPPEALSFDQVYSLYADRVYRFCLGWVRDEALAEDLGSATFESALKAYTERRPEPDGLAAWLFRIARNLIIDHQRKEKRRDRIHQLLGRSRPQGQTIEAIAETNADLAKVLQMLSRLTPRDREIVALRVAAGLTSREVAEVLGMSEVAATGAYYRALDRISKSVGGTA